jgi:hypothetical protein
MNSQEKWLEETLITGHLNILRRMRRKIANPDNKLNANTSSPQKPQFLKVTVLTKEESYTNTREFRRMFLGKPCSCCGSPSHSLMEMIPSMGTRSEQKNYKYTCSVATYDKPYHKELPGKIHLSFILDAERFAKSCKYDLSLALIRLPIHYREHEAQGFLDGFLNEVRLVCLRNQQDEVITNPTKGFKTPRK